MTDTPSASNSRFLGSRRAWAGWTIAALLSMGLLPPDASAQPAGKPGPILKTPGLGADRLPSPLGGFGGKAPKGLVSHSAATTPVASPPPGAAGTPPAPVDDPMAAVKQAAQEIAFKPKPAGFQVSFNLEDASLPDLVKTISNITGKRFIYGSKVRQIQATVYCPEKITVGEAYAAFLSILDANGMTVIPQGGFLKIIETSGGALQQAPIVGPAVPVPAEDRFVTRLYRLNHIDPNELSAVLGKFKSKEGDVSSHGNLLIITDTGTNIQRLLRLVEELDVGGSGDQLWVEPVHYAAASDMAARLTEILDPRGGKKGGGSTRIVADERTNSLIITANEDDYHRLLELIKRLDVPLTGEGEVHVLPLQHAACKELSQTLNTLLTGSAGAGAQAGQEEVFEGQIRVSCDEATNSLVVTSSLRDYAQLRTVVDQLDIPRRQVFIEAVIMDVTLNNSTDFGLGFHGGFPFTTAGKQSFAYGGVNPGQSVSGVPGNLEALAVGVKGPALEGSENLLVPGVSIPALGIVMHALGRDGNTNVLATPHVLATDNVKAEISIGQNIPLQNNVPGLGNLGSLAGLAGGAAQGANNAGASGLGALGLLSGGLGALGGSGQRADVGTKITVTPHVNDSEIVRLEIEEEISDAGARDGALGAVSINKRTAKTTAIVKDQQTIVIGGLVRDYVDNAQTKVPLLGDLPILGVLFRQSSTKKQKSNLLLILTPYVIRDQEDLRAIFERKMQERQEYLDRFFVFSDDSHWEPPQDYSRTTGLVEHIRQSMMEQERRARLEEEARPKGTKTHEPGQPIALPSMASGGGSGGGGGKGTTTLPPQTIRGSSTTSGDDDSGGSSRPKRPPRIPSAPAPERVE